MEKLLSIIVPSYNMEKYLPKCLGSLIVDDAALLQLLDVIVVNDGSKDRTSEIGHEFESKYPGVFRVIDKPNGNYGSCINVGLPIAKGEFVKILDADDTYDKIALSEFLVALEGLDQEVDFVLEDYKQVNPAGTVFAEIAFDVEPHKILPVRELVNKRIDLRMHGACYRMSVLRDIGYSQTEGISYTDTEWVFYPISACKKFVYLPISVYRYLVGRDGQTVELSAWVKNRWALEKILDRAVHQYETRMMAAPFDRQLSEYFLWRILYWLIYLNAYHVQMADARKYFRTLSLLRTKCPFLRSYIKEGFVLLRNSVASFHFVDCILNCPALSGVILRFVRSYLKARRSSVYA